jgi:[acyl-carrier-protein] S-malonyltransferase
MEPTVPEFRGYMEKFHFGSLSVPWVANVTAEVHRDAAGVVDLLARQLSSPVRWTACMHAVASEQPSGVLEVGPGKVLATLMKRIVPELEVQPVSSVEMMESIL